MLHVNIADEADACIADDVHIVHTLIVDMNKRCATWACLPMGSGTG
jgi:hypothetical protein